MVVVPTRLRTATQLAKVQHLLLVVAVGQTSSIAATTSTLLVENIILVVGLRHFLVSILFAFFPLGIVLYTEIRA